MLKKLREQIPSYNEVQKALHDYLMMDPSSASRSAHRRFWRALNKHVPIDHVFNSIQKNSNPRNKAGNKDQPKIKDNSSNLRWRLFFFWVC